jgi:hypothetical protein
MESIEDLKKKKSQEKPVIQNIGAVTDSPTNKVEQTLSEEFYESLNKSDKIIFDEIKDVLLNKCGLYEHEAFTEENIEDIPVLINLFKLNILKFNDDGIDFKLRKSVTLNSKKGIIVDKVTFLFEKNEARENQFTKFIKVKKGDISAQKDFTRAIIAASLKNIDFDGTPILISTSNLNSIHSKDYDILTTLYAFFR